jgi:ABC-2 type transport system permease protein
MRARAILGMVIKDLRRDVRQPMGILIMLAFPLMFALLLALTFGTGDSPMPKVELLVEDLDDDLASAALLAAFGSEQMTAYFEVERVGPEGRERIENGEASALLRIPAGFTDDLLRGEPTALELVRNPAESILPEISEQLASSLTEILSAGSFALREPLERLGRMRDETTNEGAAARVSQIALGAGQVLDRSSGFLFPPVITLETATLDDPEAGAVSGGTGTLFLWVLPGIAVFSLFMLGDQVMRDILVEQESGTLRRQLAGPLGTGTVVAGKVAHTAAVATICLAILSVFGWWVAEQPIDLLGFGLLALALVSTVTGTAALLYGVARNERQGSTLAGVVYMAFAFVGGSFIQTESLPAVLQRIAPYTPFHWANHGFRTLLHEGGGLTDVLPQVAILAAVGLAGMFVGSRLLNARLLRAAA